MKSLAVFCALIAVSFAAQCGTPAIQPTLGKIVGGTEAKPHSWPWQVALYTKPRFGQWYQFCGGSIINESWVLTAGHCFYGHGATNTYKVIVGAHNLKQTEPSQVTVLIDSIFLNDKYVSSSTTHDCTLLKLAEPIVFNDDVSPVCLPDQGDTLADGSITWITGWGSTKEGGQTTNLLMQTSVPTISHDKCAAEYQPAGMTVDDTMICAAYDQGGKDTCQGDSGGPMVFNKGGKWFQYGITSWGEGCAEKGYAGVYGSVAAPGIRDFIDKTLKANSKKVSA